MRFQDVYYKIVPEESKRFKGNLLAIDPGETTGICRLSCSFINGDPLNWSQEQIKTDDVSKAHDYLGKYFDPQSSTPCNAVVCEDYRIYAWKTNKHTWAELHTPQFIGTIRMLCGLYRVPLSLEMAQHAKGFVTDEKLRSWGLYDRSLKHARDATRHAIYWLFFTYPKLVK